MASSVQGAVLAGPSARGNRSAVRDIDTQDYQVILPHLPSGPSALNTIFLHADVKGRPYKVEDFRDILVRLALLPEVVALGAYQMNHLWAVTFKDAEGARKLVAAGELRVKERRCLVIDPRNQDVRLKLHWVLHHVPDDDVRSALGLYGKVTEVTRDRWRVPGCSAQSSTTRLVTLRLKTGISVDDLPHQVRVAGEMALLVVPGRVPLCLRCHRSGHIRRECRVPRCVLCRRFGHDESQCVRTYANVAGSGEDDQQSEFIMDAADAEEAAKGGGDGLPRGATPTERASEDAAQQPAPKEPGIIDEVPEVPEEASTFQSTGKEEKVQLEGDQTGCMELGDDAASSSVGKRPRAEVSDEGTEALNTGEPPSKAAPQVRRASLKPKPNIPPDRNKGRPSVT
ncbi:uncharacterized protein LOC144172983 [Haemaphysalis longicornis]